MANILIYQDYLHNPGLGHRALNDLRAPDASVGFCDADDIIGGVLNEGIKILVMPGGADLFYCERLNGAGNAAIKKYVERGGTYFGICAGAYYGCAALDWKNGEIAGPRELAFFDGCAYGPVHQHYREIPHDGPDYASIPLLCPWISATPFPVCYAGGPCFSEPGAGSNAKVLARYDIDGQPAAIIRLNYGAGSVILSGPHIECGPVHMRKAAYQLNGTHAQRIKLAQILENSEECRLKLWNLLLRDIHD